MEGRNEAEEGRKPRKNEKIRGAEDDNGGE